MAVFTTDIPAAVRKALHGRPAVFVTDDNVASLPQTQPLMRQYPVIAIGHGEQHKTLDTLTQVWRRLIGLGATRGHCIINVGGGVVTDLGGLAAATYMRGIPCINVATTVLGVVDAATGGKTAIDLDGIKNLIGAFHQPDEVIIDPSWLRTLPPEQKLSGYGEMLKHSILDGTLTQLLALDNPLAAACDEQWLRRSIELKERVVQADPREGGLRRILNLGHTTAHALEAWMLQQGREVPHGYAVAWGLVTAAVLTRLTGHGDVPYLQALASHVKAHFGTWPATCGDLASVQDLMSHDKKNARWDRPTFVLCQRLSGDEALTVEPEAAVISQALDITHDLIG